MDDYIAKGFTDLINDTDHFKHEVNGLEHHHLYVGALRPAGDKSVDFMQMICSVQNFGCTIKPVNGKYLTIPTPVAGKRSARDFGTYSKGNRAGLFFHIAKTSGRPTLARNINGSLQVVFLLAKQVNIPARGFIDRTFDEEIDHCNDIIQRDLINYWDGSRGYTDTLNDIGKILSLKMIAEIQAWDSPANATITEANKGKNDPLVDTGALQKSIKWVIEP